MASLLVYIDSDGADVGKTSASLQVLGEARRIASALGATLYAAVPTRDGSTDELIEVLSIGGADKVILMRAPEGTSPNTWSSVGDSLHSVCKPIAPRLILFAATRAGRDIAPRLAARLGAAFFAAPSIESGSRGELYFSRTVFGRLYRRRLAGDDVGQAIVATLSPGPYAAASGEDDADVLFIDSKTPALDNRIEHLNGQDDPASELATARILVTAGAGITSTDELDLVRQLAEALGGHWGATRELCRAGLADASREVGGGGMRVAPNVYISCAASGSDMHLAAISADSEIIAINSDPDAVIFRVATYGIVGTVSDLLPDMISAVRDRLSSSAS